MSFGRLSVIGYAGNNKHRSAMWLCQCRCGNVVKVKGAQLRRGRTKSCGCLQRDTASKLAKEYNSSQNYKSPSHLIHGGAKTRIYGIWNKMKQRCGNPNYEHFERYGGRGITVCAEWMNDFEAFRDWSMANGYSDSKSIDRIDNDKGYSQDNCRWVSTQQQVRNRSVTVSLDHNGQVKTLKEWADEYGINYKLAHERYRKGWEFEKIFQPVQKKSKEEHQ